MVIMGLDHFDQFGDIVRHHEAGTIPPTVMWGACPTVFDPSQAPPGRHTAFMWEKLPYRLRGNPDWSGVGEAHGRRMLELWRQHAPNLADAVIDSFTRTPMDTERSLPNMREGDLLVGAFTNGQIGYHRPFSGRRILSHASARPLPLRLEQPSRRQRHRTSRLQRGPSHPRRPRHQSGLGAAANRGPSRDDLKPRLFNSGTLIGLWREFHNRTLAANNSQLSFGTLNGDH